MMSRRTRSLRLAGTVERKVSIVSPLSGSRRAFEGGFGIRTPISIPTLLTSRAISHIARRAPTRAAFSPGRGMDAMSAIRRMTPSARILRLR